jgi:hypothetical protein
LDKLVNKDKYIAILDQSHPILKNKFWFSGNILLLSPEQAQPRLDDGKIRIITTEDLEPKKYVTINHPDGQKTQLSWGDYLKQKKHTNVSNLL